MKKPYLSDRFSWFSVLQALMAMGSQMEECGSAIEALRVDVKKGTYHNPMAISQVMPALHQRTYLHLKSQECRNEDGMYNRHASSISRIVFAVLKFVFPKKNKRGCIFISVK